ncbi:hypothetical protein [Tenacibaculum xiamenense]|uniref:hypothetical protein n=1 Tax=Tenacibaculum xiamenense TaxID=1261553 RepID=UPI0038B58D38
MKKRHQQKLVVISIFLFLAWNVPFITIFDSSSNVLGFPSIYVYIFVNWLLTIVLTHIVLKRFYE